MDIEKERERLSQQKMLDYILCEQKTTEMLTVYLSKNKSKYHSHGIYCALVPVDQKKKVLSRCEWDLCIGAGLPCSWVRYDEGVEIPEYHRFGRDDGIEPLVICRNFHGLKNNYNEISEEFRLFHNLHYDSVNNRYIKIDDGNELVIIEISEERISVRLKELKQFLSIKEMFLSIQFDFKEFSQSFSEEELSLEKRSAGESEFHTWILTCGNHTGSDGQAFSRLLGKKLIAPFPKSKSGLDGFIKEEPKKFVDFIIDTDEFGDDIFYSSNPDLLSGCSDINQKALSYFTPIHFKKEVLDKYYEKSSKYSVSDSYLSYLSLWGLQIDDNHDSKVCVWLGDLGKDLPYEEQLHWRSYNIAPSGGVSEIYFGHQILNQRVNSNQLAHIFKNKYSKLKEVCDKYLRWELLLPLNKEDQHHFESLRVPATNEQRGFDNLVIDITKIIIDSLNEKQLNKFLEQEQIEKIKGGISRLEAVFEKIGIDGYVNHIQFLRNLQTLRSCGVAHRKGSNYKEIARKFNFEEKDLICVFKEILTSSVSFLDFLTEVSSSGKLQNN